MLAALTEHAEFASANLALFHRCAAFELNDHLVRCAHDFVWFGVRAFRDAAILHLFALYDTNRRAISVAAYVRGSPGNGNPESSRQQDLALLSAKAPEVKKLLRLRNNAVGHTNQHVARQGRHLFIGSFDIGPQELDHLLNRAVTILRKYGGGPLARRLSGTATQAERELLAVTAYLSDATVTRYSLERVEPDIDGRVR